MATKTKSSAAKKAPVVRERTVDRIPDEYSPLSMWSFFLWQFIFWIPVVGWILCIAFAFMAQNHNLRNFARSNFIWMIISIISFCALTGAGILRAILQACGLI